MPPRRYRMENRTAARDEMRRRIVNATLELHLEKGVLGTSFEDIAHKADVAVATVYRYFPSLDELVAGCGGRVVELTRPPAAEDAASLFDGVEPLEERVRRLVAEYVAYYGRAGAALAVALRDAPQVLGLRQFMEAQHATLDTFVRAALRPNDVAERTLRVAAALLDFGTWKALSDRGLRPEEVEDVLVELMLCQIKQGAAA